MRSTTVGLLALMSLLAVGSAATAQTPTGADCHIDFATLGVTPQFSIERSGLPPASSAMNLRVQVVRFAGDSAPETASGETAEYGVRATYREMILIFHLPAESLAAEISEIRAVAASAMGEPLSEYSCIYDEGISLVLYSPFLSNLPDQGLVVTRDILVSSRTVIVTEEFGEARLLSEPMSETLLPELQVEPWVRNLYPWITELDFRPTGVDEPVFAVEQVSCDQRGNFILGTRGQTAASQFPEGFAVVPDALLAANAYFGASGNPTDEKTVADSVDPTRYWCLPKREFCYEEIPFGDFGLKVQKGIPKAYETNDVVSLRHGLIPALQSVIMSKCPPDPKETP